MSKPDDILFEVNELVREILDESIDEEGLSKLTAYLNDSPEAKELYDELISVHVGLELKYNQKEWEQKLGIDDEEPTPDEIDLEAIEAQLSEESRDEVPQGKWDESTPNQTVIGMIGQALPTTIHDVLGSSTFFVGTLVLSLSIFVLMFILLLPSSETQKGPIASVSQTLDAVWASDSGTSHLDEIRFGQQLDLESGFAQIKYRNGVRVNLEGPTAFIVSGTNQGILVRGKISALAKDLPAGFTVKTPVGKVIDLGTEFGIKVADNQDTEVQVFEGLVKLDIARPSSQGSYQNVDATMPAQSLELCKGEAVHVDSMHRLVRPVSYLPDQFARTYQELKPYYFEDFSGNTTTEFVGTFSVWGEEEGIHAVADGSLTAEVESCAYSIFAQDKFLKPNEVLAVDVPATKPGLNIFVVVSTSIGEPQGGPDGGIGFRLRRDHGKGIAVQQSDSNRCFPLVLDSSLTDDPNPDLPLRLVIERKTETEFNFYYEIKGSRTKIAGPIYSHELAEVEGLYIGFEVSNRDIHRQSVTFDNFSIRPASD